MNETELQKLADLARVEVPEAELKGLAADFETILGYISKIQEVSGGNAVGTERDTALVRNVMREDGEPHESGKHSETLLSAAPAREGDYVKVKKILSN